MKSLEIIRIEHERSNQLFMVQLIRRVGGGSGKAEEVVGKLESLIERDVKNIFSLHYHKLVGGVYCRAI